jgi:hypothetical protein
MDFQLHSPWVGSHFSMIIKYPLHLALNFPSSSSQTRDIPYYEALSFLGL